VSPESGALKRRQREAVIAALDDKLADHGSWCGETHLQKGVCALQDLLGTSPPALHSSSTSTARSRESYAPNWGLIRWLSRSNRPVVAL
jgi:hypothetical protein